MLDVDGDLRVGRSRDETQTTCRSISWWNQYPLGAIVFFSGSENRNTWNPKANHLKMDVW